jgi:formylglycine-generating enzyme required for sulfatase activity/serine/threonine protein kinase
VTERTPAGAAPDGPRSLPETIAARYGPGVDPGITLEPPDAAAAPGDFSAEVLARLATDGSGRYRVQAEVARGGQGAILRVWDEQLRRQLAMKVSLGRATASGASAATPGAEADAAAPGSGSEPPPADARSVGRFLEEAQVTSQLDHPGIVPVHELGLDDQGRIFFTMKLVRGEDLGTVFARVQAGEPGWTTTRVVSLLLRACEALAYAHSKRVIHRDLKPANIMVGRYGEVFVMDWGLARVLDRPDGTDVRVRPPPSDMLTTEVRSDRHGRVASDSDQPLVTMDGDVVGTPAYMSPEQAAGHLDRMGPPSDVYALGAMLYQLLTGRMPYITPGAKVNAYSVLSRVQEGPPASVTSLAPRAPSELVAICEKAMAREPADRYPDMSALAEDLRAWLEGRVVTAYETGAVAELRKWVGRNRPLAGALAAGVLALAGGLTASLVFKARSDHNAALAQQNEEQATRKANDVLSLSAIQELKDLVDRADTLWPAAPERLADYDRWLAQARVLEDGSATHPGLKDHEAKLAELRKRARPLMPEQVEQDRRANPRYGEWEHARDELTWMRRMLGEEPWPREESVESELGNEQLPTTGNELNHLAWVVVDPQAKPPSYGGEIRALLLARRAMATDAPMDIPEQRDTHAWALYRCGRLDEALVEEQQALELAGGTLQAKVEASQQRLQQQVARWREDQRPRRVEQAGQLAARIAALEPALAERRTFEFDDPQDGWWHAQLAGLVSDLKGFTDAGTGLDSSGTSAQHGWGLVRRADFARSVETDSISGPEAQRRWANAIDAIATSPLYDGLPLTPQLGLLPLGTDRDSGLWEFWDLQSGDEPTRDADGRIVPTESMGLVFVLVPGGSFWQGAQATDPQGRGFDPQAQTWEGPVHEVLLSPYFISKFEMTQGQWERFTGRNPSQAVPGTTFSGRPVTRLQPVEQVNWFEAVDVLKRMGLELPTEAQWEHAARGGTDTPWSTGRERETLRGAVNIADHSAAATSAWPSIRDWPDLDDGWPGTAPVGSYRPNPYGLFDVHGNVREWCRDGFDSKFYQRKLREDPEREPGDKRNRTTRGGSLYTSAPYTRSAQRGGGAPETGIFDLGIRPVRRVNP